MEVIVHRGEGTPFIELLPGWLLDSEAAALELLSSFYEHEASRVLIHAANLPPEFYNLRSGLAGAVLGKFATYRVVAAAVIPAELVGQGRFYEMVIEANRGSQFRVYDSREEAMAWLAS